MAEQDQDTGKLDEAEEVFDMEFPPSDEATETLHPCKQPFHFPAALVAAQWAAILRFAAVSAIGRDHLDVVYFGLVQGVGIVGFVSDQSFGQYSFHKPAFGRRSTIDTDGEVL